MKETSQAIVSVKREVQLTEWQRQIRERQEEGVTVDEWCIRSGISKGTYYHRLRKVREYLCERMETAEDDTSRMDAGTNVIIPVRTALPKEKTTLEMQYGELKIRFYEAPGAEQLKTVLNVLVEANKPVC